MSISWEHFYNLFLLLFISIVKFLRIPSRVDLARLALWCKEPLPAITPSHEALCWEDRQQPPLPRGHPGGGYLFDLQVDVIECPLQAEAPQVDVLAFVLLRAGPLVTVQEEVALLLCQHRLVLSALQLPHLLFLAPGSPLVFFRFGGQLGWVLDTGVGGVPCQGGIFHLYREVRAGWFFLYHVNLFH